MALSETAQLAIQISAKNSAGAVLGQVERQFGSLQNSIVKVGAAIASAFAVRDVIDSTRRFAHDLDALRDAMGASGEQASRWNFQARYVGATADDLASSFQILANNVYSQAEAIAKGSSDFDKLGISVLNAQKQMRPVGDIIEDLREKMQRLDAPSQAIIERQLFGRAGGRLHDFLTLTSADVARLDADLASLGMTLGSNVVDAMEQQQRELNRLGFMFDSIKLKVGGFLIPLFITMAGIVQRAAMSIKAWAESLRAPLQVIKEVGDRVQAFLADIGKGDLWKAVIDLGRDIVSKIGEGLAKVGDWVTTSWPFWRQSLGNLFDSSVAWIKDTGWPSLVTFIETQIPAFANWIVKSLPEWTRNFSELVTSFVSWILTTAVPNIVTGLVTAIPKIGGWIIDAVGWMSSVGVPAVLNTLGSIGAAIVRGILQGIGNNVANTGIGQWFLDTIGWISNVGIPAALSTLGAIGNAIRTGILDGLGDLKTDIWNRIKDAIPGVGGIESGLRGILPSGGGGTSSPGASVGAWRPPSAQIANPTGYTPGPSGLSTIGGVTGTGISANSSVGTFLSGLGIALAGGGVVMPRPGGTLARIGEAGQAEAVIPLDRMSGLGGGQSISITVNGDVDSRDRVRELARAVGDEIMRSTRQQRNFAIG